MADIIPQDILELPYVDRNPDPSERPDQRRIEWVKNGECLGGAESTIDNGGELNRGPVQVQRNVATLIENDRIIHDSLTEVITRVNSHDAALGEIGDDNLATKLEALEEKVDPMVADITTNKQNIFLVSEEVKRLNTKVGSREEQDTTTRNVMQDLFYVKTEIGNYEGKNIDGGEVAGNPATGIKARLVTQGLGISSNTRRIISLEDKWQESDVGSLQASIDQLRLEVGPTALKPADKTVYKWIRDADAAHTVINTDIQKIKDAIGTDTGETLNDRITANKTLIEEDRIKITENTNKIDTLTNTIGTPDQPTTILNKISTMETSLTEMVNVVGETENDGMRVAVTALTSAVGTEADANTILGRLKTTETNVTTTQREMSTIKNQVGSNTPGSESGLTARVRANEITLRGADGAAGIVKDLEDLTTTVGTKVGDVADNKKYIRTQGAWEELGTITGVPEAPNDGSDYVRRSQAWHKLGDEGISIADGKKIKLESGTFGPIDVFAMKAGENTVVLGNEDSGLELKGDCKGFVTDTTFNVHVKNAGSLFKYEASQFEVGSNEFRVILVDGTSGNEAAVKTTAGTTNIIWHEGNFADNKTAIPKVRVNGAWDDLNNHIAPAARTRGGFMFENNTSATDLTKDSPVLLNIGVPVTNLTYNVDIAATQSEMEYSGTVRKPMSVTFNGLLKDATAGMDLEIAMYVNGSKSKFIYRIKESMWGSDNSRILSVTFPYEFNPNDKIDFRAIQSGGIDNSKVTLESANVFVMEM